MTVPPAPAPPPPPPPPPPQPPSARPHGLGPYAPTYAAAPVPPPPPALGSPPPGGDPVTAPPMRSGLAVAALVAGIVGIVTCLLGVASVLATVFGLAGARQIRRSRGALTGIGMARAGWITGLVGMVLAVLFWVWAASDGAFDELPGRGMQVGTCVDLGDLDVDTDVAPTVDCAVPHDAEVFEIGWLDPRRELPYPGAAEALAVARAACAAAPFADYVGIPSDQSGLRIDALVASAGEWSSWRGEYVCLARPAEGRATGSVHQSRR